MIENQKILVVDDDPQMQIAIKASLSRGNNDVVVAGDGQAALGFLENDTFDVIVSDQRMPRMNGLELLAEIQKRGEETPFIMITAYGTINQAVEAIQLGAADFITKPFSADELSRVVERVISPESKDFRRQTKKGRKGRPIITNNPMMIRILEVAEAVAKSDATVLVQGESGTGKELIARLIHASSAREKQPFVAVNCAAMPDNLLESELFGHEKGAFTGAQAKKLGKFELAQGGTVLLDEISEMNLTLQAKLLRVLQEREIDRVGGKDPVPIDVRVVATTNRNLADSVQEGKFREDLYYRLNVIPITLPPLRDRKDDIKLLVTHFMRQYLGNQASEVPVEVLQALENYSWPGNVRELQNSVERAAILSRGNTFKEADFLLGAKTATIPLAARVEKEVEPGDNGVIAIRSGVTVAEMEKALILETLRNTGRNRTLAAQMLGISIRTLRNKLNEYKEE